MPKSHKIYYSMGQVCEMFDLPASTIRFWETRFTTLRPKKNAKGNRLFSADDIETLKLIYHLTKEKKMTLSGAQKFLMQKRVAAKGEMSLVEMLQKVKATLLEIRQELESTETRSELDTIITGEQVETIEPNTEIKEKVEPAIIPITPPNTPRATMEQIAALDIKAQEEAELATAEEESTPPEKPKYIELTLF
ncbi:MAG: MerR family transcriptional regulator [Mucinivorans sp.]